MTRRGYLGTIVIAVVLTASPGGAASPAVSQSSKTALGTITIDPITSGPVDIVSVQWGVTNDGSGPSFGQLKVTKGVDATTPLLIVAIASGSLEPQAVLNLGPQAKGGAGGTFVLEHVVVRSLQTSIDDQGNLVEDVGLSFGRIQTTVGGVTSGWDLELKL